MNLLPVLRFASERARRVHEFLSGWVDEVEHEIWLREQASRPPVPASPPLVQIPAEVVAILQNAIIERSFEDALFPSLVYKPE